MGKMISAIIIEKSSFPKNTQIEECEKKEGNYILRFQRPAATSLRENCVRFFSDLFNGVTKAQDMLCNLEGKLPPVINIKGQSVIINKQSKDSAEGKLTSYDKNLPVGAENIAIFMRHAEKHPEANQNTNQTNDAYAPLANSARVAPPPPSIAGRPPLSTARSATIVNQAPPPPSRDGRPKLSSANEGVAVRAAESKPLPPPPPRIRPADLTALEQNHEPINLRPPPSPPPSGEPITLNNGSAKKSATSQDNEQNLKELIQSVKLKINQINPRQGQQAGLDLSPQNALLNKVISMRKDIEGDDKKPKDEDWE